MDQLKVSVPQVIQKFEDFNEKYFNKIHETCKNLVDVKAAVYQHDKVLDEKIIDFQDRIGTINAQHSALQEENKVMEAAMS